MSMTDTVARWLKAFGDTNQLIALRNILKPLAERHACKMLKTPVLAIKAGASALAKADEAIYALVDGILVTKAADTDMPAFAGTVVNATFNVFVFYIDKAGALTAAMGTAGATIGAVVFPPVPENKTVIGFVLINPTGTGNFVGGTTALDDGTVVPGAVYFQGSELGGFDPSILPGV